MSAQKCGLLFSGALLVLSLCFASACRCCPRKSTSILTRPPSAKQPVSSTRFVSDGTHVVPVKLQNTPAEYLYEGLIGGYSLSRLSENELYVVFRDRRRNVDTVYKLNNISGEIVYYFNEDRMSRKYTFDHQLVLDITDTGRWTMDLYRRDKVEELFEYFRSHDLVMLSKLINSDPTIVNAPDENGLTLLMQTRDDQFDIARLAIESGADVNARDINGDTPLHFAAKFGCINIAKLLVSHRANVDAKDSYGDTPLHVAVKWREDDFAYYLVQNGANSNIKNGSGETAMRIFLEN